MLKTSGSFNVGTDDSVAYIIDWDLRKSIVEHSGSLLDDPESGDDVLEFPAAGMMNITFESGDNGSNGTL